MHWIDPKEVESALGKFAGQDVYLHVEVTPGGFARNLRAFVQQTFLAGQGPFRAALKLSEDGWIRVEGLTHWVVDEANRLILAGHDDKGRLTVALELSFQPFPA